MTGDITVPPLGESITEATVARWLKQQGDYVQADEPLVELETDKVTLEVNAPVGGYLSEILVAESAIVAVGSLLGRMQMQPFESAISEPRPLSPSPSSTVPSHTPQNDSALPPAVRKMVADHHLDPSQIPASGKDGRLTKGDVLQFLEHPPTTELSAVPERAQPPVETIRAEVKVDIQQELQETVLPSPGPRASENTIPTEVEIAPTIVQSSTDGSAIPAETRVRMSRLRQRIAQRLKEAQNTAAILTTFNEVDMSSILGLRERYKEAFEKKHGVRLGIMSFFVKAAVDALKEFSAVNATIEGDEMVYKNTYDIGVAVGTDQGLVVPVIRRAETLSLAGIEHQIALYSQKARQGQLKVDDLTGGTFTISNGGVYGSLMSTPILNPPQSAILGMHKTQKRAVVDASDQIVIRPMMYVALSYDHRIIDGKEAVSFLVRIKEKTENPERMLLDL